MEIKLVHRVLFMDSRINVFFCYKNKILIVVFESQNVNSVKQLVPLLGTVKYVRCVKNNGFNRLKQGYLLFLFCLVFIGERIVFLATTEGVFAILLGFMLDRNLGQSLMAFTYKT